MKLGPKYSSDSHQGAFAWIKRAEATVAIVATLASGTVAIGQMRCATNWAADAALQTNGAAAPSELASQADAAVIGGQSAGQTADSQASPSSINPSVPDDATLVSKSVAVTDDGTALDVQTGQEITDSRVVGTQDTPPDPLAVTGGIHYTQRSVGEARAEAAGTTDAAAADATQGTAVAQAIADTSDTANSQAEEGVVADNASYPGNSWGAYWTGSTLRNHDGSVAVEDAKYVIDVSQFQGTINWAAVKAAGVQGAIIRVGYGWGNAMDPKAAYNISQCKKLGIPFGVYLYSYAATASQGSAEGRTVAGYLQQLGLSSSDLKYPIYYDLEKWVWTGHSPSNDPSVNASIVRSFVSALSGAGYGNVSVYSYTSYLDTALNSSYIHSLTTWVAQYGAKLQFSAYGASANGAHYKGWQYSDAGTVNGISGYVDLDAFAAPATVPGETYRLYNPNSGEHFFTLDGNERNMLVRVGWRDEGVAWIATTSATVPVYRLYNPNAGEHHYTMSLPEKNWLVALGWKYEGVAWYSDPREVVPIYRVYNPHAEANGHLYTVNANEASMLAKVGWNREGIGWYAAGL